MGENSKVMNGAWSIQEIKKVGNNGNKSFGITEEAKGKHFPWRQLPSSLVLLVLTFSFSDSKIWLWLFAAINVPFITH